MPQKWNQWHSPSDHYFVGIAEYFVVFFVLMYPFLVSPLTNSMSEGMSRHLSIIHFFEPSMSVTRQYSTHSWISPTLKAFSSLKATTMPEVWCIMLALTCIFVFRNYVLCTIFSLHRMFDKLSHPRVRKSIRRNRADLIASTLTVNTVQECSRRKTPVKRRKISIWKWSGWRHSSRMSDERTKKYLEPNSLIRYSNTITFPLGRSRI